MGIVAAQSRRRQKILIETFQRRSFLKQRSDVLTTPRTREIWRDDDWAQFGRAYQWMRGQYSQRVQPLPPAKALLWGWPSPHFEDMQYKRLNDPRTASVRIWAEVPDDLILSSNFDGWHYILSELRFHRNNTDMPITQDWETLFDRQWLVAHDSYNEKYSGDQVVFPYIRREWIQKVKYFRGQY